MKKILIIEDDLIVRSIYRRKFEMSGYTVETAEEGAAALALLPQFRPDVIQVDIMLLPGMDGVEVIRQIRANPEFKKTPGHWFCPASTGPIWPGTLGKPAQTSAFPRWTALPASLWTLSSNSWPTKAPASPKPTAPSRWPRTLSMTKLRLPH